MDIFKEIEVINNSDLNEKEKDALIKKKRDRIITQLMFLVYSSARQYRSLPNYEDLVQEGLIGLIKATRKFEWRKFPNFFIYCRQWIINGILKAASRFDVVYNPNKIKVIYAEPLEEEIDLENNPDDIYFTNEIRKNVIRETNKLPERERSVVKQYFGIGKYDETTLQEIGAQYNLSRERVRQIKDNALCRLKNRKSIKEMGE